MEGNVTGNATAPARPGIDVSTYMTWVKLAIGLTGVFGNLLVIVVILKYKALFNQVKSNVINQSVIDCLVSVMLIETACVRSGTVPYVLQTNVLFCKLVLSEVLLWGLMLCSTFNLMAISIERYLAIVHPVWYKVRFSKTMAYALMAFTWLFGISFQCAYIIPTTDLMRGICLAVFFWPSRLHAVAVGLLQIFIVVVLPFIVHSICYVSIAKVLRNSRIKVGSTVVSRNQTNSGQEVTSSNVDQMPSTSTPSDADPAQPNQSTASNAKQDSDDKASNNLIKTFSIVTATYFVCWLPQKVYVLMYMSGQISTFGHVYQATLILVFLNCCINPFIYIANYDAFKKGMAMLFRCQQQSG